MYYKNKAYEIENRLSDLIYYQKINLNDIVILFSYNHIKAYLNEIIESDSVRYSEIIYSELLSDEINELNKYLDESDKIRI